MSEHEDVLKEQKEHVKAAILAFKVHKAWVCSCGMYWIWSEEDARRHAKEDGHELTEIKLSDEEFERLKKDFKGFV